MRVALHDADVAHLAGGYCMSTGQANAEIVEAGAPCLNCNHEAPILCAPEIMPFDEHQITSPENRSVPQYGAPAYTIASTGKPQAIAERAAVDARHGTENPDVAGTLQAKENGGWSANFMPLVRQKFIVRRLTPLECCRLQGFPDGWGEIENLDDMDEPTLAFWRQVYITYRKINELPVQASMLTSKERVLRWHNGLHTDAAEYKMWGNGMAKPNAQFVVRRACEYLRGMPDYTGAITLGSLFDGSGTMPLCIEEEADGRAVWASEVEPYPIAVTRTHLPGMLHLGSVTEINGAKIAPVDIITFGSPCQDLSIAGKRAGLKHEAAGDEETTRSGMFMEAVRIAREMYAATDGQYPKIMIWENVPGAFSSNGGEDFETVLNELLHIVHPNEFICRRGKWPTARDYGAVAYRTFDAQFWGVPQRRRRVYALVDLRGECAGEILFEPRGMPWDFAAGGATGQGAAPDAQGGPRANSCGGGATLYAENPLGV